MACQASSKHGSGTNACRGRPWLLGLSTFGSSRKTTVALFEKAFVRAVQPWLDNPRRPKHPLASKFPDIVAWDSTPIQVADTLRPFYKGTPLGFERSALRTCPGA